MAAEFQWFTLDADIVPDPPLRVYRIYRDDRHMLLQRWDPPTNRWVDTPGLSAVSGIGGVSHYEEVSRGDALAIIGALSGSGAAEANMVTGLEETLWPRLGTGLVEE